MIPRSQRMYFHPSAGEDTRTSSRRADACKSVQKPQVSSVPFPVSSVVVPLSPLSLAANEGAKQRKVNNAVHRPKPASSGTSTTTAVPVTPSRIPYTATTVVVPGRRLGDSKVTNPSAPTIPRARIMVRATLPSTPRKAPTSSPFVSSSLAASPLVSSLYRPSVSSSSSSPSKVPQPSPRGAVTSFVSRGKAAPVSLGSLAPVSPVKCTVAAAPALTRSLCDEAPNQSAPSSCANHEKEQPALEGLEAQGGEVPQRLLEEKVAVESESPAPEEKKDEQEAPAAKEKLEERYPTSSLPQVVSSESLLLKEREREEEVLAPATEGRKMPAEVYATGSELKVGTFELEKTGVSCWHSCCRRPDGTQQCRLMGRYEVWAKPRRLAEELAERYGEDWESLMGSAPVVTPTVIYSKPNPAYLALLREKKRELEERRLVHAAPRRIAESRVRRKR